MKKKVWIICISLILIFGFNAYAESPPVTEPEEFGASPDPYNLPVLNYPELNQHDSGFVPDSNSNPVPVSKAQSQNYKGKIIDASMVKERDKNIFGGEGKTKYQEFKVKLLEGPDKGKTVFVDEYVLSYDTENKILLPALKKGKKVYIYSIEEDGVAVYYIDDIIRTGSLVWALIVFFVALFMLGGKKSLRTIVSLTLTVVIVLFMGLPLILRGVPPILTIVLVAMISTIITLLFIGGRNKKTFGAIIGTCAGFIIAGIFAGLFGGGAYLSGIMSDSNRLLYIPQNVNFDLKSLLFAGIMLGSLGACMDIAMSISSSITYEFKRNKPAMSESRLIRYGMRVGSEMMGTMANTLILAYIGSSLQAMLVLMAYDFPLREIINREFLASEVIRVLAGSIGILSAIPCTVYVTVGMLTHKKKRKL